MDKPDNINRTSNVGEMDKPQLARWIALFEGVNIIADNAEKSGQKFDTMHIKQPALEDYVDKTSILIYRELTRDEQ